MPFRPLLLQDPPACQGLLDAALRVLLLAFSSTPVGTFLSAANALLGVAAVAPLARLLVLVTGSLAITAAVLAAILATSVFERTLAPAVPFAVLGVCAAGWVQLYYAATRPTARRSVRLLTAFGLFTLIPLLAPSTVGWCSGAARPALHIAVVDAVSAIGPLPFFLAALGVFAAWPVLQHPDARLPAVAALIPLAVASLTRSGTAGTAILSAGLWCLAALGLATVVRSAATSVPARALAIGLLIVVPALQIQRLWRADVTSRVVQDGHETMTLDAMRQLVRIMPETTVVEEDASLDLLLRAARVERLHKRLKIVPRQREAVAAATERGTVFAFARAQRELQYQGVGFANAELRGAVARVEKVQTCAPLIDGWREVSQQVATGRFALVAATPNARGPVEIYLGGVTSPKPQPHGWAARDRRGFHAREYERARRPDLEETLRQLGIDASGLLTAPHITRLELWRTPSAPPSLPVALAAPPAAAVARVSGGPGSALDLCPWFEYTPIRVSPAR